MVGVYPSTGFSVTVYLISLPSLYFGRPLKLYFQLPFPSAFTSAVFTCVPSASRLTMIFSGRFPSRLFASSQVLVPATSIISGVYLFVISKPLMVGVYPSTGFSVTVYLISLPFLTLRKSVKVYFQLPFPSAFTSCSFTLTPSANRLTMIFSGRFPSRLFASSQVLVPATLILIGLLVMV